jgi:hypothetical protein
MGLQPLVVIFSNRILAAPQERRTDGTKSKEIHHIQLTETPDTGEPHQTPQGGIVAISIGTRGIKTDKQQAR